MARGKNRRLFISADGQSFQLFTISQNRNDGSVYLSSPQFESIDWHAPETSSSGHRLASRKLGTPGKLSVHGGGVAHLREHAAGGRKELEIVGAALEHAPDRQRGIRHLLTIFPSKPSHIPGSPVGQRKMDHVIEAATFSPFVFIFWAIPLPSPFTITVGGRFNVDDLENGLPDGGYGTFELVTHRVIWFAYRTKLMSHWPVHSQGFYLDGLQVPLMIGTGRDSFRLEYRPMQIVATDFELQIHF